MKDIVEVLPDKDGRYIVKLYGITFELVPKEQEVKKPVKNAEKVNSTEE